MKKIILSLSFSLLAIALMAQHETLFGNARVVGGFGAPIIEFGIGNDLNTSIGGGGGIVINNFFLGGYGMGGLDFDRLVDDELTEIEVGHGGFWLGSTFKPHKILHLYGSARIGWGAVSIPVDDPDFEFNDLDKIFVLTPELGVELNVTKWFRVAASGGYRWVTGTNEAFGYNDEDFSGAIATLSFRFGWFGWHRH
ncbi:MAG: hypothetical protein MRY78_21160 [Saprospiraceae bacterium]|nr:hypothetical protein [Saprospiraceae bacterium]